MNIDTETTEKSDIYEQAGLLADEGSEESLEKAIDLYRSLKGWQDADRRCADCELRLNRMRWQAESERLKALEKQNENKVARWKKIGLWVLISALLFMAVTVTVPLVKLVRYNRAVAFYTAGEYERAADAFIEMEDYRDSRSRVFMCAIELYKKQEYEKAIPYFIWLDGYPDNGHYLNRCYERMAERDSHPPES